MTVALLRAVFRHVDLESRLENWARAVKWYGGGPMSCLSAEGHFRSPQHWYPLGPRPLDADVDDAREVESAVCILPLFHHALLRGWYVRRWTKGRCLTVARLTSHQGYSIGFDRGMREAQGLLGKALTVPAVIRKVRAREIVLETLALAV